MPTPAEPPPDFSDPVALTACALDELDSQVADADSRQHNPGASIVTPGLQVHNALRSNTETSSSIPRSDATRLNFTSSVASKNAYQHHQHNNPSPTSSLPATLLQRNDASMTDYLVDGLVYRSPDTLGSLIEVLHSPGKGFGVFARHDLAPGTLLLSERPLVKFHDDGARNDPLDGLVNALGPVLKKAYRSLHGYQDVTPSSTRHLPPPRESLNRRVLYSNGFAIETCTTAVFALASRINHSCVPNAKFGWDVDKGRMDYVAIAKLLEGEEVTIDYGHKKGHLKKFYGFECDCGGCTEWGSVSTDGTVSVGSEGEEAKVRLVHEGGFWRPVKSAAAGEGLEGEKTKGLIKNGEDCEHEKENSTPPINGP